MLIAGEQMTTHIVALRSEFSAGAFHASYPRATQSAFLEGIAKGFEFLGGVPATLRLDNLTLAVARVLRGKQRIQHDRFIAFRSHYLFEASFTTLGIQGAHEKGGIENECGRFRRRWLTPMPSFDSWEQFNDYLLACCVKDLDRRLEGNPQTVGELLMAERPLLRRLPAERFETAAVGQCRVDQKCRIRVHTNHYSVPASLVGRVVSWKLSPLNLQVFYQHTLVASHPVLRNSCRERLVLDHYLEVLLQKPGALAGSLPLHQARIQGWFDGNYELLWSALRRRLVDSAGTRAMIEILLLHRTLPREAVDQAVRQAVQIGSCDPGTVALLARRYGSPPQDDAAPLQLDEPAGYDRPVLPTEQYDLLVAAR